MLSYIEHDCAVDLTAEGPLSDHFRVFFHTHGSIQHKLNGQYVVSDCRNTVVHAPGIDLEINIRPFGLLLLSLRGEFVRTALTQRYGKLPPLETWVGAMPASPCSDTLRSMATWLCSELDRSGSALASEGKPRLHAERMLLATFIECLAQTAPEAAVATPDIGESQARRAEEWIDAHLTDAIGVEEIAGALGVGVRSLQRTFQRVRGRSPLEVLLQRRLERAREALLTATPGATVTTIAAEFGFFELGRFARQYKGHFGESPSATLARRRGAATPHPSGVGTR